MTASDNGPTLTRNQEKSKRDGPGDNKNGPAGPKHSGGHPAGMSKMERKPGGGGPPRGKPPWLDQKPLSLEDLFAKKSDNPLAHAFEKKAGAHPFLGARPVPKDEWPEIWQDALSKPRVGKSVAYLHIPFCENHCLFCGFYQNPWRSNQSAVYASTIIEEIKANKNTASHSEGPIHAVYFGGGTPTALEADDLCRIIEAVREHLPLAADCEITIEGRIYSFPIEKARAVFAAGANRISLGVQTFDTRVRRRMGRKVTGDEAKAFLEELTALDQGAVVIDLIYGFPEQSLESWQNDVETAANLDLDGVDLYSLKLIPSSPLAMSIEKGKFKSQPKQEDLGQFYKVGYDILAQHGWETISTTHWRRTTRERNLYNHLVKTGANGLAFGSGAGGNLSGYSFRVDGELGRYVEAIERGEKPFGFMMKQPDDRDFLNAAKGQMEVGQLQFAQLISALDQRGLNGTEMIMPVLRQWQDCDLLSIEGNWAKLSLAGRFWQVAMTQMLLQWIQQNMKAKP